jgi:proline dehydrogenase
MLRRSLLFLSEREGFKNALLKLPGAKGMATRFAAGETGAEALRASRTLNRAGFRVTLDYLGESVRSPDEAERATRAYLDSLVEISSSDAETTISLKLTQLGLDIDEDLCTRNVGRIVEQAEELDNFVRIDMEDSHHTAATLRVFRSVFPRHRNVGVVIQSYLRRSAEDVDELVRIGAPVRLCKGAYQEPGTVAFQRKSEIDDSFIQLMKRLLDGGVSTAIASHDERMIEATSRYVEERGISREAFEFQMLYGVRRDYQALLVEQGYGVRIYVPYGTQWYPYFMRRMAERPANLVFVARAILGN